MAAGSKKNQSFGFNKGFLLSSPKTIKKKKKKNDAGTATKHNLGFNKGFLLSSPKTTKKKNETGTQTRNSQTSLPSTNEANPALVVSSALLDLEEETKDASPTENLLLFAQDDDAKDEATGPLHLSQSKKSGFGIQEVSSKPLIAELEPDSPSDGAAISPDEESRKPHEEALDLTTITDNEAFGIREVVSSSLKAVASKEKIHVEQMRNTCETAARTISSEEQVDEQPSASTLVALTQHLNRILVRRRGYQDFVLNHLEGRKAWGCAWKVVLTRAAREDAALDLGVIMMKNDVQSTFVESTLNAKDDKAVWLGAALILSDFLRENETWLRQEEEKRTVLQSQVLPILVSLVQDSVAKRTALAQEAMKAAYGLLTYVDEDSSFQLELLFTALLSVHEQWLSLGTKKDSWRRRCTLTMIQDWKAAVGSETGLLVHQSDMGGLRQTLLETQTSRTADEIVSELDNKSNKRAILRGSLATFGRDKKLWQQEATESFVPKLLNIVVNGDDSDACKLAVPLVVFLSQACASAFLQNLVKLMVDCIGEDTKSAASIGGPLRESLLRDSLAQDDRYALVLESICHVMWEATDQMAPLALFGALVDEQGDDLKRLGNGVVTVLTICSRRITESKDLDIYQRLAPLLLLRRVPAATYKTLWDALLASRKDVQNLLSLLVTQLKATLISTENSPAERKLAADISGRCLPFTVDDPYSSYTKLCLPPFRSLVVALQDETTDNADVCYQPVKEALFVLCCHVPVATDGVAIKAAFSFAIWLLQPHKGGQELCECQQGCMEFVAACLQTSSLEGRLIETVQCLRGVLFDDLDSLNALATTQFGSSIPGNGILQPSVKICIWNAYLLVSQRVPEGSLLNKWASDTGPWLLDWIEGNEEPLFAIQILFVLVSRTKSIACVDNQLQRVNQTIRLAMQQNGCAVSLRLLLAVITMNVHLFQSLGSEADETIAMVAKVAASSGDDEFRAIAKQMLSV